MKKIALIFILFSFAAKAEEMSYAERMKMLQEMQHKRPDASSYVNSLKKTSEKPTSYSVSDDGHYYVPVLINGKQLEMMADTGASSIFLSHDDAQKMGVNMSALNYNIQYNTANGKIFAAEIIAKDLKVGEVSLTNVPITISQARNNDMSLLGMEFFKRLSKYEVKNGVLTLYK